MAFLKLKQWSIKKKLSVFAVLLVVGGGAILALTVSSLVLTNRYQKLAKNANEVDRYLGLLEMDYYEMSMGLVTFVSTGDEAAWKEKERADKAAEDHFNEIKKLELSEDVKPYIEQLGGFDEKYLHPIDLEIAAALKDKKTIVELMEMYKNKYIPTIEKVKGIITDGSMISENDMEVANEKLRNTSLFSAILMGGSIFFGTIFGFIVSWILGSWLGRTLETAVDRLEQESGKAKKATAEVNQAAQTLAAAATEQAAALQETAASVEEMSAMITKSAENAAQSGDMANSAVDVANRGKQAAGEMIQSIREINESNNSIMKAVEESNQKITEITKVIGEIGNKTKVINDIVFQTKLLSFNASVEAARAGEHGKGFAVVAEEVGNLAQMSGNAAKEIAQMLDASIAKVEGIVTETKTKVERLISEGKTKVAAGTKIAEESGKVLDDISEQVNKVSTMVNEISTAAREQAQGVSEITKAMGQLDSVTQQNTTTSAQIANNAEQMANQTQQVRSVVHQLEDVIYGDGMRNTSSTTKNAQAAQPVSKARVEKKSAPREEPKVSSIKAKLQPQKGKGGAGALGEEGLPEESDPRFKEI